MANTVSYNLVTDINYIITAISTPDHKIRGMNSYINQLPKGKRITNVIWTVLYWFLRIGVVFFASSFTGWAFRLSHMVRTGLEKSWNLTLDLKSHGILYWPGKMAFCLEKSLKISGGHWKMACAMLNLIWTWKHWWLYDKKCNFVITFETILVKPCLQTCIAELLVTLLQIPGLLVTL